MSEDFRIGFRAKVERDEEQIENIKAESDAFLLSQPPPYRIVRNAKNEGRAYDWYGFAERPVPPIVSILAGEAIHQLRSSLDHLVSAMARERGNEITSDHGFPVTKEPKIFKDARDRGQINGISLAAQNLIESLQPYNTRDVDSSILWTLHRKDIEDKHRLLMVVSAAAQMRTMTLQTASPNDFRVYDTALMPPKMLTKEGVQIAYVSVGEAGSDFDPEAQFSHFIA